jgi:hypothetical protein
VKRQILVIFATILMLGMVSVPASASGICVNTTDCTLQLDLANGSSGFGSGNFGTVHFLGDGVDTVTITVSLLDGWNIIKTGFPASFGFTDSLAGTPTIGNFSSGLYSGSVSDATQDLHFDGFGYVNTGAATSGPHNGAGLQTVSFDITQTGLTDVNFLLNPSLPPAGDGQVYFVVDAGQIGANTGLLGVSSAPPTIVPEPGSFALLLGGLGLLALSLRRRRAA